MKLNILSPERKLVEGYEIASITLPTAEGQIQVLPGHAALVGVLATGVFSYTAPNGEVESGAVSTGFFDVNDEEITVLAETLELKGEVDLSRALAAQKKAEEMLTAADLDEHQFKKYQLKLERSIIRQQLHS